MHLQLFAAMLLTQLPKGLFFYLSYAFARKTETLSDFFERKRMLTTDPEVESGNLGFAGMQKTEGSLDVNLERLVHQRIIR